MKSCLVILWSVALVASTPIQADALEAQRTNLDPQPAAPSTPSTAMPANGILPQVTRLLQAGTAPDVIVAFIRSWAVPYSVTADDILHLHDIGASTDVLTALITRSSQLQAQMTPVPQPPQSTTSPGTSPPAVLYPYPEGGYGATQTNVPPVVYPSTYSYPSYSYPAYSYGYPYYYGYYPYSYYSYWGWPYYGYWGWPYYSYYYYGHGYHYGYGHPGYHGGYSGHPGGWGGHAGGGGGHAGGGGHGGGGGHH